MRAYKSEAELRAIAEKISETITIRIENEKGIVVGEECRDSNPGEQNTIYTIAYGFLLGVNFTRSMATSDTDQVALDVAEFILQQALHYCQTYLTLYIPLRHVLEEWEEEK